MQLRLVLFDIDGTLVRPCGLGRRSLEQAFSERFGVAGVYEGVPFHGRTDPDILNEGIARVGAAPDEIPWLLERYLDLLEIEVKSGPELLLPGVRPILTALSARSDTVLGLVTGNVRRGAQIKLSRDGLFDFFAVGAFGGEAPDRTGLVRLARRRAADLVGHEVEAHRAFHVGDTTNDVVAARDGGVRSVAVATGGEDLESLRDADPDHLFPALEPTAAFLEVVLL